MTDFISPTDPASKAQSFDRWFDYTGVVWRRNPLNTGWTYEGYFGESNLGWITQDGLILSGGAPVTIQGVTSFAPLSNPDFKSSVRKDHVNLATENDFEAAKREIYAYNNSKLNATLARYIGNASLTKTEIAVAVGTKRASVIPNGIFLSKFSTGLFQIPLPTFKDGEAAAESNCQWMLFIHDFTIPSSAWDHNAFIFDKDAAVVKSQLDTLGIALESRNRYYEGIVQYGSDYPGSQSLMTMALTYLIIGRR